VAGKSLGATNLLDPPQSNSVSAEGWLKLYTL